jgi:uncharacterized membrane protein YeaQ/YmgE (transglycosylase-associated protein family)
MWGIIVFLIVGLLAGLLARALVPGKDSMGILATLLLGIVGSFVGGTIWSLFRNDDQLFDVNAGGLILSVIGAVIALLIYNRFAGGRTRGA